jgi:hypothetical protein
MAIYSKNMNVQQYLSEFPEGENKRMLLKVRDLVLNCADGISEDVKWGSICFMRNGNFCGFKVGKGSVSLVVFNGAMLSDPTGLFNTTSSGAKTRTIKWTAADQVRAKELSALLKLAATTPVK